MKVLHIDDAELTLLQVRRKLLRTLPGVEIMSVSLREQGMALIRTRRFDACITDWLMPGGETCQDVVDECLRHGVPVCVLTGLSFISIGGAEVFHKDQRGIKEAVQWIARLCESQEEHREN